MTFSSSEAFPVRPAEQDVSSEEPVEQPSLPEEASAAAVQPAPQRQRGWLVWAAKLAVAAGLLLWLILSGRLDLGRIVQVPLGGVLALLFGLLAVSLVLPVFRWWWLLRIQGLHESLGKLFALTWFGYFASLFLPGAAGADLTRGYLICRRHRGLRTRAVSTVLADRVIGLCGLLFLGLVAVGCMLVQAGPSEAIVAVGAALLLFFGGMTLGSALFLFVPTRALLLRFLPARWRLAFTDSFEYYRLGKRGLAGCFCLSVVSNLFTLLAFATAASLLGLAVPLGVSFATGPIVALTNSLPVSPGGIGLGEAVLDVLMSGLGAAGGAEIMLLIRVSLAVLSLPGVLVLLFRR
jgi:uncharacterized membrane protein YbhN (UPF0104 family)